MEIDFATRLGTFGAAIQALRSAIKHTEILDAVLEHLYLVCYREAGTVVQIQSIISTAVSP